ncbi:hypothetical protein H4S02_000759 [Coemansia sp. RSA 2611]|nr:hypothetical protein LPJ70_004505 [Coemansia sp. RSA 2708]KAJ2321988.1 hypothetical protein IWW52_000385 [Coemansia sp. RSA 2704]KAJ2392496.1 hypothetical protein H4S02_000759 [Coemansia sp. RSA 2611]
MVDAYAVKGKVAVITGGAQSLGLCIAQTLARLGARILIGDIDAEAGARAAASINHEIGTPVALFHPCDVADSAALHALIDLAQSHFGRFDILANNAGILDQPWSQDPEGSRARLCVDINVRALIDGTNHALHVWQKSDATGVVVNLASASSYYPAEFLAAYAATKAAVAVYTKALAGLAPKVRVNAVAPVWIDTKFIDSPHIGRDHHSVKRTGLLLPEQVARQVVRLIEDQSLAGDIIIMRTDAEPTLCTLPKATDILPSS